MADNYFSVLYDINVSDRTEEKNGLTYLSWAWAWAEMKKHHPNAVYTVYENANGWCYHTDGKTAWVKTGVTVEGIEHIEYLPIMDTRNRSIPAENVTSFDVNKAIQRSLTKACARHGLGLYIYAGEDLPESAQDAAEEAERASRELAAPGQVQFMEQNMNDLQKSAVLKKFGVNSLDRLTRRQAEAIIAQMQERSRK